MNLGTRRDAGTEIHPEEVAAVTELFERGLYIRAYERASAIAPLVDWRGTAARVIAGRIANNVGSSRIARWLHSRAWLADRTSIDAAYFHASDLLHYRGPFAAWRFFERLPTFKLNFDRAIAR